MPRALLSVSNKMGIVDFAQVLIETGWELVASGGTQKALEEANIPVTGVEQLTGQPEMLGGRVKTLHPAIHGGILARDRDGDMQELMTYGFAPINMVVCNLYPFTETVGVTGVSLQDAIEQIDIGGVALLRAAAKNFLRVITICDPNDYVRVAAEIKASGSVDMSVKRELAVKVFKHTRDYDTAIHAYLSGDEVPKIEDNTLPDTISISVQQTEELRYGENPHQVAGYYSRHNGESPLGAKQLGGKQLSHINILDADASWRAVSSFTEPSVVIVKHLNPTGIASADTASKAFSLALASDPISAFGCVMAVNRQVDATYVDALGSLFVESIVAPSFTNEAVEMLNSGRKNCRLLQMPHPFDGSGLDIRSVMRGFLVQRYDMGDPDSMTMKTVTNRVPLVDELASLRFAWQVVQHVKSNSIVLVQGKTTVGIGGGLSSRVDAAKLAIEKAGDLAKGSVLASDAFFPFPDSIEAAANAGITSIIQPGGSIRDAQVIEAANAHGIAMVFTGTRHFRH